MGAPGCCRAGCGTGVAACWPPLPSCPMRQSQVLKVVFCVLTLLAHYSLPLLAPASRACLWLMHVLIDKQSQCLASLPSLPSLPSLSGPRFLMPYPPHAHAVQMRGCDLQPCASRRLCLVHLAPPLLAPQARSPSCVVCLVCYVVCRVSCVVCRVSCVLCLVSCVVCLVSCAIPPGGRWRAFKYAGPCRRASSRAFCAQRRRKTFSTFVQHRCARRVPAQGLGTASLGFRHSKCPRFRV